MKKQEEKRLRRFGLIKEEGNGVAEGEAAEGESEVMETGSDVPESVISGDTSSENSQSETT